MESTLSFFLTDHTISVGRFRLNAHGRAVFILCCQLSFSLIGMVKHLYIFALTEKIFFKTSRYSVLAWIFSGFYFAKAEVSSIYYFHIPYSFLHFYPSRVYVTNLAASGVTDQSSSWFEDDRRGRAGFEFSSWLAWIFSDNVWQVHKFKSAMTILFTDIVSTTRHRVKQQTACNFTARTTAFFVFSGTESNVLRDWTGSYKKTNKNKNSAKHLTLMTPEYLPCRLPVKKRLKVALNYK